MLAPLTAPIPRPASRARSAAARSAEACSDEACSDEEWIADFARSALTDRHLSASTFEAYRLDLTLLSRWAEPRQLALPAITSKDLTDYVTERAAQGARLSTLARHLSSFRRFFDFLASRGVIAVNPAALVLVPHAPKQQSGLVRDHVLRKLLRAPQPQLMSPSAAFRTQRDHTIVCMLYGSGLGISDVRLLSWQQVDEQWSVVRVPVRGGAPRSFVLDATLLAALRTLRAAASAEVDLAHSAYCFPTAAGLPMTRQALCHVVRKWARECGQAQVVTPSSLRQTGRAHHFGQRHLRAAPALA